MKRCFSSRILSASCFEDKEVLKTKTVLMASHAKTARSMKVTFKNSREKSDSTLGYSITDIVRAAA